MYRTIKLKNTADILSIAFFYFPLLLFLTSCAPKLHQAVLTGDPMKVTQAINDGERFERQDIKGNAAIHLAALENQKDIIDLLLKKGDSLERVNSFQQTALSIAAYKGHLDLVTYLVGRGAKLERADYHKNTPLMLAAKAGQSSVVEYLYSKGANIKKINGFKESAHKLAFDNGHLKIASYLSSLYAYPAPKASPNRVAKVRDRTPPNLVIEQGRTRGITVAPARNEPRPTGPQSQVSLSGLVTDDQSQVLLWANGKAIELDQNGRFSFNQPLQTGANEILFLAEDQSGNQTKKTIRLQGQQALVTTQGRQYALVIGNNDYKDLPKLKTPLNDAKAVAASLQKNYGFKTEVLLNAGRNEISQALNRYRKSLLKEDSFILYYAGHGTFDKSVNKAYWLPLDASRDDDTNWLITDSITAKIQRLPAKHVLVVADSCYSGTLSRSLQNKSEQREGYLQKVSSRKSRTLMASGGNEPVSDSSQNHRHSIFAWAFLQALERNKDTAVSAENLFYKQVKEFVAGSSEQVPEYSILRNSGHEGGDFVFYRNAR